MPTNEFRRLSAFYFFFFAALGAFVPYRGRYFDAQGFDSFTIGIAMALTSLVTIAAPFAWAALADHSQRGRQILLLGCIGSIIATSFAFYLSSALGMILAIACYSIFWNAIGPQTENLTLSRAAKHGGDYSRIRLWGSVGYILTVLAVGYGVQWQGVIVVVPFTLGCMGLLFCVSLLLPRADKVPPSTKPALKLSTTLLQPASITVFLACLLATMSHAPFYTFFDLYLRHHHYQPSSSGWFITLGVLAEIILFYFAKRIIAAFDYSALLISALVLSALRWLLLAAFVEYIAVLILVQLLHAVSFALLHTMAMHFLHHVFPVEQRGRAQALYGAIAYGIGGTLGNLISGALWRGGDGGALTFTMAGAYCGLAAFAVYTQRHCVSHLMRSS